GGAGPVFGGAQWLGARAEAPQRRCRRDAETDGPIGPREQRQGRVAGELPTELALCCRHVRLEVAVHYHDIAVAERWSHVLAEHPQRVDELDDARHPERGERPAAARAGTQLAGEFEEGTLAVELQ